MVAYALFAIGHAISPLSPPPSDIAGPVVMVEIDSSSPWANLWAQSRLQGMGIPARRE